MARQKNYTIGAGKLFFDRFDDNGNSTGEFYIGNTTSLTYSVDEERQEHFSSDEASRDKDASIVIRSDSTIGFTTDDIQPENLAMLFKGEAETLVTAPQSAVEEDVAVVARGRWYQLGTSEANPSGLRGLTISSVEIGGNPVANPAQNYELDETLGRIFVLEDAPGIAPGSTLQVTYDVAASSRVIIIEAGEQVRGALRYIADNTAGANNDHYFPLVEISPDGDVEFKGDDWSAMSFSGEILKKGNLAKHYVDGRPEIAT